MFGSANGDDATGLANPLNTITINELKAAMELYTLSQKPAKTPEEALKKSYQFWNTQPVPKMGAPGGVAGGAAANSECSRRESDGE